MLTLLLLEILLSCPLFSQRSHKCPNLGFTFLCPPLLILTKSKSNKNIDLAKDGAAPWQRQRQYGLGSSSSKVSQAWGDLIVRAVWKTADGGYCVVPGDLSREFWEGQQQGWLQARVHQEGTGGPVQEETEGPPNKNLRWEAAWSVGESWNDLEWEERGSHPGSSAAQLWDLEKSDYPLWASGLNEIMQYTKAPPGIQ